MIGPAHLLISLTSPCLLPSRLDGWGSSRALSSASSSIVSSAPLGKVRAPLVWLTIRRLTTSSDSLPSLLLPPPSPDLLPIHGLRLVASS